MTTTGQLAKMAGHALLALILASGCASATPDWRNAIRR
jgi:hypothetical protein